MKNLILDFKDFYRECRAEDFGFYMAAAYIIFSYLRPQAIIPGLDIIPWTQISIILGLFYAAANRKLQFQFPHFIMLMFAIVCSLSTVFSEYPKISYKNWDIPYIWFLEILFFTCCISNLRQFRLITILFFLVLFKISFFGARTWAKRGFGFSDFGISGPSGYFQNSGELSLLMAMLAIMSLSIIFKSKSVNRIYFLLPITAAMTVLAASSRGSQLALLIGGVIFFTIEGKFKFKYLFIGALLFLLTFILLPDEQKQRFTSAGQDSTSQARLFYWSKGLEMLKTHPILGVGYNCFPSYIHDHYADQIPSDATWGMRREVSHNTFIQVSSQMGILGLWTYMWLCLIVFKLNRNTRGIMRRSSLIENYRWVYQYSIGLDIAQLVFFVGAFFMSVAFYPYNYFMIMFALSMNNVIKKETLDRKQGPCPQETTVKNLTSDKSID